MNIPEIIAAMRLKYQQPEWGLLFEVRNQTGFGRTERYADALAFNMYPSTGLHIHGFEFKTSRQDLMNELRNPVKHEEIAKHCNFWWLVLGDSKIIKDGELPEAWGLMVPRGNSLMVKKHAQLHDNGKELPVKFVVSLIRSALRTSPAEQEINIAVKTALEAEAKRQEESKKRQSDYRRGEYGYLEKKVKEFKEASGIDIEDWHGTRNIGAAVKFVLAAGGNLYHDMEKLRKYAEHIVNIADEAIREIK